MNKYAFLALMTLLLISYSCTLDKEKKCNLSSDCHKGMCPDGHEYSKYSCNDGICRENEFVADPCLNHYGGNGAEECTADSDCGVGGCSGQICGRLDKVKDIVTTCEFREDYSCLKLTKCGCVGGKCLWKENNAYRDCMDKLSNHF